MSIEINPNWVSNAVLIYGPRKGGTTLLLNLHDGSDELLTFPTETKIKFLLKGYSEDTGIQASEYWAHSLIKDRPLDGLDLSKYKEYWMSYLEKEAKIPLSQLLMKDAEFLWKSLSNPPQTTKCWAMKEVGGDTHQIISTWLKDFPEGRIVSIVRNPHFIVRSILLNRKRQKMKSSIHRIYRECYDALRVISGQFEYLRNPRMFFVVYEELTDHSGAKKCMSDVARFLGLRYSDIFEKPTVFRKAVIVETSSQKYTHVFKGSSDWKEGLSFREQLFVGFFLGLLGLTSRWFGFPFENTDYPAMAKAIREQQAGVQHT